MMIALLGKKLMCTLEIFLHDQDADQTFSFGMHELRHVAIGIIDNDDGFIRVLL